MREKYSYIEIATVHELWCEYVDPHATMSEKDFDEMTTDEKVEMQVEMFGPDCSGVKGE